MKNTRFTDFKNRRWYELQLESNGEGLPYYHLRF